MTPREHRFHGMVQILVYNWPFYVLALFVDLLAIALIWRFDQSWLRICAGGAALLATYGFVSSLAVSHYVYDLSPLYRWKWIPQVLGRDPASWVNIHAGLDESSAALTALFPTARSEILDIYSATAMSEPSIRRARRRAQQAPQARKADPVRLPLEAGAWEAVFLLFAAHELRERETRIQFFREINRSLTFDGQVLVVEHLRDWRNFLAYGPGAMHFFAQGEWRTTFRSADFEIAREFRMTPFVKCFLLVKAPQTELEKPPVDGSR